MINNNAFPLESNNIPLQGFHVKSRNDPNKLKWKDCLGNCFQ